MNKGITSYDRDYRLSSSRLRQAELIEVIRVQINRGEGTKDNLARMVNCYFLKDGTFIGEEDSCDK